MCVIINQEKRMQDIKDRESKLESASNEVYEYLNIYMPMTPFTLRLMPSHQTGVFDYEKGLLGMDMVIRFKDNPEGSGLLTSRTRIGRLNNKELISHTKLVVKQLHKARYNETNI